MFVFAETEKGRRLGFHDEEKEKCVLPHLPNFQSYLKGESVDEKHSLAGTTDSCFESLRKLRGEEYMAKFPEARPVCKTLTFF